VSCQTRDRKIVTRFEKQFSRGAKECGTPAPDYIQLNTSITYLDRNITESAVTLQPRA